MQELFLLLNLKFHPRNNPDESFSGKVWVDKQNFSLLRIDLSVENTTRHPFIPYANDSIYNISIAVSRSYNQEGSGILPDHINFTYQMTYKSKRDSVVPKIPNIITRDITTKGVMYFYDYNDPFILPYFDYDADYDDYRKISIIPYNEVFWSHNNTLLLTEKQKENLGFFSHEGYLINFKEGNYGKNFLKIIRKTSNIDSTINSFYEFNYTFWSPAERIILNRKLHQNSINSATAINGSVQSDLYNLKVQILLDVTALEDSVNCRSYTIFDANKTFYHLPEEPYTKAFLNIYFDICEIERRKLEHALHLSHYSVSQIDSIYKKALEGMENITQRYLKDVQIGKNESELINWNQYVKTNLGIDNVSIFQSNSSKN